MPYWCDGAIDFDAIYDGTAVTTLTAGVHGVVTYRLDPAALGLSHGHHVLTLRGMLITTKTGFVR